MDTYTQCPKKWTLRNLGKFKKGKLVKENLFKIQKSLLLENWDIQLSLDHWL